MTNLKQIWLQNLEKSSTETYILHTRMGIELDQKGKKIKTESQRMNYLNQMWLKNIEERSSTEIYIFYITEKLVSHGSSSLLQA